jgi:hypothetical protein
MLLRRIKRLTSPALAATLAVAILFGQGINPACACAAAPAESCCCAESTPCGCSDSCLATADRCQCQTASTVPEPAPCSCFAAPDEAPATVPNPPIRVVDVDSCSFLLPATAVATDVGIHGSPWATAFDLEAFGGPPGLRLHALLCVWRN